MLDLILKIAKEEERIRALYMFGSRANAVAETDKFSDFDIGFVVTETRPFIKDKKWLLVCRPIEGTAPAAGTWFYAVFRFGVIIVDRLTIRKTLACIDIMVRRAVSQPYRRLGCSETSNTL